MACHALLNLGWITDPKRGRTGGCIPTAVPTGALSIISRRGARRVLVAWAPITLSSPRVTARAAPGGDGTLPFLGLRSLGPTSVSASSISRLGLCLDLGNGAGSSAASDDWPLGAGSAAGSAAASPARAAMAWMAFATALPEGSVHFPDAHPPSARRARCTQALRNSGI